MLGRFSALLVGLLLAFSTLAADNRYELGVKGLACPFCAFGIEKRLNRINGVTDVQVDVGDGVVRVSLEEGRTLSEAQAAQAVKEAGFSLGSFSRVEARAEEAP